MLDAIGLALLTGACWSLIGIVFSQAADRGLHPALMSCLNGLGVALITGMQIDWSACGGPGKTVLIVSMSLSGLAMTGAMVALQQAMRRGGHGVAWAVAQAGLVWPFLIAVFCHGEQPELLAWLGLLSVILSLFLLAETEAQPESPRNATWFAWALSASILIGIQQSAFQWPSLSGTSSDPAGIQVPLMCAVGGLSAALLLVVRPSRSSARSRAPLRLLAGLTAMGCIANAVAQPAIAESTDLLAIHGSGGIAFPIAIASCIALFVTYGAIHRAERPTRRACLGLVCCLAGVVLMSL